MMGSNQQTIGISERFMAGSLAGVFAQSVIYPMEVSRQLSINQSTSEYIVLQKWVV